MVAMAIALSAAIENSGLARAISTAFTALFAPVGDIGLMFGIYIATVLLNSMVSNSAAVSLTFPIAFRIAQESPTISVKAMSYMLMMAGSADFSTPIGYQTNLMVYSIGGYRFSDYIKFGVPLQIICAIITVPVCYYAYPKL